jgi:hypothetical protein
MSSCVQKTYERKVKFILDVSQIGDIKSAGIRGSNNPLNWQNNFKMTEVHEDSIYTADITFVTGYLGAEFKFVVNDLFELQDQDNRKLRFEINKDTTFYRAKFNQLTERQTN